MVNIIELIMFVGFTIYVFIKALAYGIYEIKQQNNKVRWNLCYLFFSILLYIKPFSFIFSLKFKIYFF